ncbi:MAG TPA: hypothetical protein VKJ01_23395 [Candidatus Solibacter sp.]|nr:hypothetical protein [Candidatus Solibacter sp.]
MKTTTDDRGILEALLADGRFLLSLTSFVLVLSGGFAIFQSLTGYFLPQDVHALGFDAERLAAIANPRVVKFMFHDRVAFGGTLLSIGFAYWYLAEFPMRAREPWAWWTFCVSGVCGFASFLSYLSFGYLDNWHGIATLCLLPVYLAGLWRARPARIDFRDMWRPAQPTGLGRWALGFLAAGIIAAGATIVAVGMTSVFVPQDLAYMHMTRADLQSFSPRLVPVIAHDRAGFGGGLFSTGIILLFISRLAPLTRSLVQTVALMGLAGFGAALGVHPAIGYTDTVHLAPAYLGCLLFIVTVIRLAYEHAHG